MKGPLNFNVFYPLGNILMLFFSCRMLGGREVVINHTATKEPKSFGYYC